jgi:hypothetical protein
LGISGIVVLLEVIAVIDPDLDADVALGGLGLGEAVLDPRPQRGQRDAARHVALRPRHLRPGQPARHLDADALGAGLHRRVDGPLHRAAEARTLLQLLGHVLRHQLRIDLRPIHFHRLDLDVPVAQVFEVFRQLIDLLALLADNHADAGRVDEHRHLLARPLDADLANAGAAVALLDELPDLEILH